MCLSSCCFEVLAPKAHRRWIARLFGTPARITATVSYCAADAGSCKSRTAAGTSATNTAALADVRRVVVTDGRGQGHSLERDGFALAPLPLHLTSGHDLYDPGVCSKVLYPLAVELLHSCFPSARKCVIFDHIARNQARFDSESSRGEVTPMLADGPARGVHGDYTVRSGYTRARSLLEPHESKDRIDMALQQRFAFVNIWVPLVPVERDPLGLIEWSSQEPRDVRNLKFVYAHRVGEIYRVVASEKHRWVYYKDMIPGESLVLKVFDSAEDGRARFSLHASLGLEPCPAEARTRESIELRCIVFFGALPDKFAESFIAPHLVPDSADQVLSPEYTELEPVTDEW